MLRYPPYTVLHQCSQAWQNLCFKGFQDFVKSNDDYILHYTCIILCIDVWRYFSIYRSWNTNYIFNLHPLIPWIIRHMRNRQEAHDPIWWLHDPFCSHLIYFDINLMSFSVYIWHLILWSYWCRNHTQYIFFLTCDYCLLMVNSLGPEEIHLLFDSMDTPENGQPWSRLWLGPLSETSHCHNQWESSSLTHTCVTRPQWVHTDRNCQCTRVM